MDDALEARADGLLWAERDGAEDRDFDGDGCGVGRLDGAEAFGAAADRRVEGDWRAGCLGVDFGAEAPLDGLDGGADRVGWAAFGADFACERPADLGFVSARSLRAHVGTTNNDRVNNAMITTDCFNVHMPSLLSLTAKATVAFLPHVSFFSFTSQGARRRVLNGS